MTAKHNDGFVMWPSEYTTYDISATPWKEGKGDVVGEFAAAAKKYGLKYGYYYADPDRSHPDFAVQPKPPETVAPYVQYQWNQITELLDRYGDGEDIFQFWSDAHGGGGGWYGGVLTGWPRDTKKSIYGNRGTIRTVGGRNSPEHTAYFQFVKKSELIRARAPNAIIWYEDNRWSGNETGVADSTNWLGRRLGWDNNREVWAIVECDTTMRLPTDEVSRTWFHSDNSAVRSLEDLVTVYYSCVGRNSTLIFNVAPAQPGLVPDDDVTRLKELRRTLDSHFRDDLLYRKPVSASHTRGGGTDSRFLPSNANDGDLNTYWATPDVNTDWGGSWLEFNLGAPTEFNTVLIQEYIALGQRVADFSIAYQDGDGRWVKIEPIIPPASAGGSLEHALAIERYQERTTTIGYKRILRIPSVRASKFRLFIWGIRWDGAIPLISNVELYNAPRD